jgi:hypothetical protein
VSMEKCHVHLRCCAEVCGMLNAKKNVDVAL